jgi:hypothetical protein
VTEVQPRAIVCSTDFDSLELRCFTRWLRVRFGRGVAFIVLVPRGDTKQAMRAVQIGARECIDVPVEPVHLRILVAKHVTPG